MTQEELIKHLHELLKDAADAGARVEIDKRSLKFVESLLRLDASIDGKNAEVREAQYYTLAHASAPYQEQQNILDDDTASLALYRAEIEVTREMLALERRNMDLETANTNLAAATAMP